MIKSVDDEIVNVFEPAFADVPGTSRVAVRDAVPGWFGSAVLTDPETCSNTGIEMEARPSGKTVAPAVAAVGW